MSWSSLVTLRGGTTPFVSQRVEQRSSRALLSRPSRQSNSWWWASKEGVVWPGEAEGWSIRVHLIPQLALAANITLAENNKVFESENALVKGEAVELKRQIEALKAEMDFMRKRWSVTEEKENAANHQANALGEEVDAFEHRVSRLTLVFESERSHWVNTEKELHEFQDYLIDQHDLGFDRALRQATTSTRFRLMKGSSTLWRISTRASWCQSSRSQKRTRERCLMREHRCGILMLWGYQLGDFALGF